MGAHCPPVEAPSSDCYRVRLCPPILFLAAPSFSDPTDLPTRPTSWFTPPTHEPVKILSTSPPPLPAHVCVCIDVCVRLSFAARSAVITAAVNPAPRGLGSSALPRTSRT